MIRLYKEFIRLLLYPVTTWIFLCFGLLLLTFTLTARVELVSGQHMFIVNGIPFSTMLISSGFGLDLLLGLLIVFIATNFGSNTLNSHLIHIILPRVKKRWIYLTTVYAAFTTLVAIGISGFFVMYVRIETPLPLALLAWLSTTLYLSVFAYAVFFFMNFRSSSKLSFLLVFFFLFLFPFFISIFKPFVGTKNIAGLYFTDILFYLETFLTPYVGFEQFSTNIYHRKIISFDPLLRALPGFVAIISGSYIWFNKKDIH
jgi:hypothetical protein